MKRRPLPTKWYCICKFTETLFSSVVLYTKLLLGNITTSILDDASICSGRADGNYALIVGGETFSENFVSCIAGEPYCRFCQDPNADTILHYSEVCNQCLSPTDAGKYLFLRIICILIICITLIFSKNFLKITFEWSSYISIKTLENWILFFNRVSHFFWNRFHRRFLPLKLSESQEGPLIRTELTHMFLWCKMKQFPSVCLNWM